MKISGFFLEPKEDLKKQGFIWQDLSSGLIKYKSPFGIEVVLTERFFANYLQKFDNLTKLKIELKNIDEINLKHNKDTKTLECYIYDNISKTNILVNHSIIDENEIYIKLLEKINGYLVVKFTKFEN